MGDLIRVWSVPIMEYRDVGDVGDEKEKREGGSLEHEGRKEGEINKSFSFVLPFLTLHIYITYNLYYTLTVISIQRNEHVPHTGFT